MQTHTGVSVQLYISDSDFNREPIDIAIRYGSSNDLELAIRWCVSGKGIAAKSCLDMSHALLTEQVVPLLS